MNSVTGLISPKFTVIGLTEVQGGNNVINVAGVVRRSGGYYGSVMVGLTKIIAALATVLVALHAGKW